jgi:5'-nucleotidase
VSNDDGYQAPGLMALIDSLVTIADVVVAAPLEQQSGTGHGITFRDPISVQEVGNPHGVTWYVIDAKPATVVRMALTSLMDSRPDLVVTGVNTGENTGVHAWVSGTVAGAREAALHGFPAIASSVRFRSSADYAVAAGYVKRIVLQLREAGAIQPPLLLNVNIPPGGVDAIRGIRVAPMSLKLGEQRYDERMSPRGGRYFWDNWSPPADDPVGDTDLHAFIRGYVTITPLVLDQTDLKAMPALEGVFGK